MQRMFRAARDTYVEYQHSHNPPTDSREGAVALSHSLTKIRLF